MPKIRAHRNLMLVPVVICVLSVAVASVLTSNTPVSNRARKLTTCPRMARQHRQHGFRLPLPDPNLSSCAERCDTVGHNHDAFPCQCNSRCTDFDDCCDDYESVCRSCEFRCGHFSPGFPCQCNNKCSKYDNCCDDYENACREGAITNGELAKLSEEFLLLDQNNVVSLVNVRLQGANKPGGPDLAPMTLLDIMPAAKIVPTISKLLPLLDNYLPAVGKAEVITDEEREEERQFLDAIFATPVIQKLEEFLASKSIFFTGSFRSVFHHLWFGMYSRRNNVIGSSGFEHVFLGELKNGVSGFHNWIYFANEEVKGALNYKGHIKTFNYCQKGQAISHTFDWLNTTKSISSMFIGSSPEFDMAIYTLCFYARPNSRCPIRLNSLPLQIQTYDFNFNGDKYIGSAYPLVQ